MQDNKNRDTFVTNGSDLTLEDLSKPELINIIKDLHRKIRFQEFERIEHRAELEKANSLAQRYKTRLQETQEGHFSLVTDAVMDALSAPPATVPVMTSLHYLDNVEKAA